ncbi:isocitrate dehydrogenase kinase/phosphatase-domain containing protein [Undibacterium arcticum]
MKHHDRVGRMADTLEYSNVAFPRSRFAEALLAELKQHAPSMLEEDGDQIIIRHLYIERRMVPLNIYLAAAEAIDDDAAIERGIIEYGNAIKELMAANIFPRRHAVQELRRHASRPCRFYDYDEIEYISDCNFRTIPEAHNEEDEMAAEPWYPIAKNDVFPEQLGTFLLGNTKVRHFFHEAPRRFADRAVLAGPQTAHNRRVC